MRILFPSVASAFLCLLLVPSVSTSQSKLAPSSEVNDSLVTELSKGIYKIGTVTLDKNNRFVSCPGAINMQKGLIEYLAVARGGKTHESVLVLDIEPFHLQTALLLLGLEGGEAVRFQGDSIAPQGDPVEIWVEWEDTTGEKNKVRGEDLVYNMAAKKTMPCTNWIFTGSRIIDSVFVAQVERSIVATYHDPYTIIDNPLPTGADDTLYEVNEELVPIAGTPILMIIKAVEKSKKRKE